jgi:hypothetical protein
VRELAFLAVAAEAQPGAARLDLRISTVPAGARVRGIDLRCEVRIEAGRRAYSDAEAARLVDLFGPRSRWRETVRGIAWTALDLDVPGFSGAATVPLVLPCALPPDHGAGKYLRALEAGDVPLSLLFRGAALYETPSGALEMAPIPWSQETAFRLPAAVVRQALAGAAA